MKLYRYLIVLILISAVMSIKLRHGHGTRKAHK
jgi:hypothetical protein